jgi:phosphate transport system permease protein
MSTFAPAIYRRRKLLDHLMRGLSVVATALALLPLFLILGYIFIRGSSALSLAFFTQDYRVPELSLTGETADVGGIRHAIVGTLLIAGVATLLAVPIGMLGGIYLSEYGRGRIATMVRFFTDVLSGAPSIVVGVVVYVTLVQRFQAKIAIFGSMALAILMIPVIVRTTEEILKLVPYAIREAAIALGTPRWRATLTVVLPAAKGGIVTGIMLAFARAAGETAPLLVTVFVSNTLSFNVLGEMGSLPMYIYRTLDELSDPAQYKVLWGAAFVLTLLVVVVNILVRLMTWRRPS